MAEEARPHIFSVGAPNFVPGLFISADLKLFPKPLLIWGPSSFMGKSRCAFWLAPGRNSSGRRLELFNNLQLFLLLLCALGAQRSSRPVYVEAMLLSPGVNKPSRRRKMSSEAKNLTQMCRGFSVVQGQK